MSTKNSILTIDDDAALQDVMRHYLEEESYQVEQAFSLEEALSKVETGSFDVILLDLVLPDGKGLNLIPNLSEKSGAGIIVVSGKTDTTEKIVCLEMGADDYMTKPFELRELSARIKAVTRRSQNHANDTADQSNGNTDEAESKDKETIYFDDGFCLNRSQFQLFDPKGEAVDLTVGEFKLLEALILANNRALSREQLFDKTRDGRYDIYDRSIDIQVGRLRKKLKKTANDYDCIKTVRGVGYMFSGKIKS